MFKNFINPKTNKPIKHLTLIKTSHNDQGLIGRCVNCDRLIKMSLWVLDMSKKSYRWKQPAYSIDDDSNWAWFYFCCCGYAYTWNRTLFENCLEDRKLF